MGQSFYMCVCVECCYSSGLHCWNSYLPECAGLVYLTNILLLALQNVDIPAIVCTLSTEEL